MNLHLERQYIESPCTNAQYGSVYNYGKVSGSAWSKSYIWHGGPLHWDPLPVQAGETVTVWTELDWNREHLAKDFSVTAWGELGNVTIRESSGKPSAHYYVAGPQGGSDPAPEPTPAPTPEPTPEPAPAPTPEPTP